DVGLSGRYALVSLLFFFFQAEDGIRDFHVTGVQTCALPISGLEVSEQELDAAIAGIAQQNNTSVEGLVGELARSGMTLADLRERSEERRVGKEGRARRGA